MATAERGLLQLVEGLRQMVGQLEPDVYRGSDAARLVGLFAEVEKLGAAGRTLMARRVDDTGVWRQEGHRNAATWLAIKAGTSVGQAMGALDTARRLDDLPATKAAFRAGQLSDDQVREVAAAASASPQAEADLLRTAALHSMKGLKERCLRVRLTAAPDHDETYDRIHGERVFRHSTDPNGGVHIDGLLTPVDGARVVAAVEARAAKLFDVAYRAGRREHPHAYAADALVELVTGARPDRERRGPQTTTLLRLDYPAFARGHAEDGETCELAGIGPVPVSVARALAADSILKVVVTHGVDVRAVASAGRTIPTAVRTALELRDPTCVVPGCDIAKGLEIDHWQVSFAEGGPSELWNLCRLCRFHHRQKHRCGYRLVGGPGRWTWEPPRSPRGPPDLPPGAARAVVGDRLCLDHPVFRARAPDARDRGQPGR
jgi:hypothetical protein